MKNEWVDICDINDIPPMGAVCALHDGKQVAIFNLSNQGEVKSICNYDPVSKASVLSRGIIGDIEGRHVVSSPLHKQHFSLDTGECLQHEGIKVNVYPVRVVNSRVQLQQLDS